MEKDFFYYTMAFKVYMITKMYTAGDRLAQQQPASSSKGLSLSLSLLFTCSLCANLIFGSIYCDYLWLSFVDVA